MADSTKATTSAGNASAAHNNAANAFAQQQSHKETSSAPSISSDGKVGLENLIKQFENMSIRIGEIEKEKGRPLSSGFSVESTTNVKGVTAEGKSTDKDLNRLLKVVGKVRLDPHVEEEVENIVDQWEEACETLDIEFWSLRILSLRPGSKIVRDWIRKNPREDRTWEDYKNALGRYLFPDSDYHLQLEEKIMKQDRSWKISAAIATIIKSAARHQRLLVRWGKSGELKDDKLKQALLNKVNLSKGCMGTQIRIYRNTNVYGT